MKRILFLLMVPVIAISACSKSPEAPAPDGGAAPAAPAPEAAAAPEGEPANAAEPGTTPTAKKIPAVLDPIEVTDRIVLFDGTNLDSWELYLQDEGADPAATWTVADGVVKCTGDPAGYMRTKKPFKNYRLKFDWRWPGEGGNNGALVHIQLPDKVWPKSIEAQLQADNAGDLWVVEGADFDEHTDPENRRVEKRNVSTEFKPGEWNNMIIECRPESIHVYVNEALQNIATNPTVNGGYIGLQSEGTPIEFRNIVLEPL
ncbi:MAG: DUF1080 domain-containing protein [Candidatus Hydrogenedentes bacterium]|nr:DUF1080 domain-containing protein [Candidatus Hydrogenedentota bacterium]